MLSTQSKIFSRQNTEFSYFSQKTGFDVSCKLCLMGMIGMKCQILFSWENIINSSSAELAQRVVKVKTCEVLQYYFYPKKYYLNSYRTFNKQKTAIIMLPADNSCKNWWNLPMRKSKADLHNMNVHIKFGENTLRFIQVIVLKVKIWMYCGQITLSKIDKICLIAIPNQISTISMCIPNLVKIHRHLLKLSSRNENMDVSNISEILPSPIPNQISTISMHTPSLVKIHWYLL